MGWSGGAPASPSSSLSCDGYRTLPAARELALKLLVLANNSDTGRIVEILKVGDEFRVRLIASDHSDPPFRSQTPPRGNPDWIKNTVQNDVWYWPISLFIAAPTVRRI
jgi:hypothetical protein